MDKPRRSRTRHVSPTPEPEAKEPGSDRAQPESAEDLGLRFQILSAEYGHVTTMLTTIWSGAVSRTNLYFGAVSAGTVTLALLANSSRVTWVFLLVALAVLFLIFAMGVIVLARLLTANRQTVRHLQALNRIRHFFVEIDPAAHRYITLPIGDEATDLFGRHRRSRLSFFWGMTQMPTASVATLVALIDAFVAAALIAVVYMLATGGSQQNAVIAATFALGVGLAGFEGWVYLDLKRMHQSVEARFPASRP